MAALGAALGSAMDSTEAYVQQAGELLNRVLPELTAALQGLGFSEDIEAFRRGSPRVPARAAWTRGTERVAWDAEAGDRRVTLHGAQSSRLVFELERHLPRR